MKIENDYASLWIENNLLFFIYKEHVDIDLKAAIKIVEDRLKIQNGLSYPILCDIRGIRNINIEARDYLASEGSLYSTAVALISNTPLSDILSAMYVANSSPKVPTKVFTNYDEGLQYLKKINLT